MVQGLSQWFKVFHSGSRSLTVVQGLSQWFRVFHSGSSSFTVVQGLSQWFKVFHSGSRSFIGLSVVRWFKGAQDHPESTDTVVKHTHGVLMLCTLHLRLGLFNVGNTMPI